MQLLGKEEILSANDLNYDTVDVPEWGGKVRIKMLSGMERDSFDNSTIIVEGKNVRMNSKNIRAKLCALSIVDEKGKRLFDERDVIALGKKSAIALDRVYEAAQRLNGMGKELEEIEKNLLQTQTEGSN